MYGYGVRCTTKSHAFTMKNSTHFLTTVTRSIWCVVLWIIFTKLIESIVGNCTGWCYISHVVADDVVKRANVVVSYGQLLNPFTPPLKVVCRQLICRDIKRSVSVWYFSCFASLAPGKIASLLNRVNTSIMRCRYFPCMRNFLLYLGSFKNWSHT